MWRIAKDKHHLIDGTVWREYQGIDVMPTVPSPGLDRHHAKMQPADYSGIPSVLLRQRSGACDGVALQRGVMSLAGAAAGRATSLWSSSGDINAEPRWTARQRRPIAGALKREGEHP